MSVLGKLVKSTVVLTAALVLTRYGTKKDHPGNDPKYDPQTLQQRQTALSGKQILWLGSSFSAGTGSGGTALTDYLKQINDAEIINESLAHSYLSSVTQNSAVKRFRSSLALVSHADYLVIEVSPIDAEMTHGAVSDSMDRFTFNIKTTTGALEYLIAYARELWDPVIILFTLPYCSDPAYEQLLSRIHQVSDKWNVHLIDMYNDRELENPDPVKRSLYMSDISHPTKAGLRDWIVPYMQEKLLNIAAGGRS
ncbi:MAG: SGNH/GDSL hydrolase family protein [Solobacterium sp.]|nr:SGNH/GDSL hydrolase family protein [Solobacterium sp.]